MTYCLLANTGFDWNQVMTVVKALPMIFLFLGAIIGFATGVRKMPKAGLAWALAATIYSLLLTVLKDSLGDEQPIVPVIVATMACAIASIFFFTMVKFLFYPYDKEIMRSDIQKILEKEDSFRRREAEEMEELEKQLDADEEDFERLERDQYKRRKRYLDRMDGKPSLLSRFIAAFIVGVDTVFILRVVIDIIVLIISATPLATGKLAGLCSLESYQEVLAFAQKTALDYFVIGAFMFAVKKGYESGVLIAIYYLVSSVASMAAVGFGFYIPFSDLGAVGGKFAFTAKIVEKVATFAQGKIAGRLPIDIPATVYEGIGKVSAGVMYTVVLLIVMAIVTSLLRNFADISYNNDAFHVLDGVFGIVLGVATCVVILAAIFFVLLFMEKMGWYAAAGDLFEGTQIFDVFYTEFGKLAGGIVDKVVDFYPFK